MSGFIWCSSRLRLSSVLVEQRRRSPLISALLQPEDLEAGGDPDPQRGGLCYMISTSWCLFIKISSISRENRLGPDVWWAKRTLNTSLVEAASALLTVDRRGVGITRCGLRLHAYLNPQTFWCVTSYVWDGRGSSDQRRFIRSRSPITPIRAALPRQIRA